jgi:hypothetical protein
VGKVLAETQKVEGMRRMRRLRYVMGGEVATSRLFYTLHRAIYRLSGGRILGRSMGCPVILLTTTGRWATK